MANYFSVLLTVVTILTGLLWALDTWKFKPARLERVREEERRLNSKLSTAAQHDLVPQPWWAEYSQSIFPVIAAVLILRSFLYEPFQIPSGSMMPTLLRGDFILVEKFAYSVRDPLFRGELIEVNKPERGDVAVFKFPPDPRQDFIKRVVGLPGDRIIYRDKTLYIQAACAEGAVECPALQQVSTTLMDRAEYFRGPYPLDRMREQLGAVTHDILVDKQDAANPLRYYQQDGTAIDEWVVPANHYFMMGDNRDNSEDSRYWGFVHQDLLVGEAVFIWMSFEMDRPASSWLPQWVPTGVRWERLGPIGIDETSQ